MPVSYPDGSRPSPVTLYAMYNGKAIAAGTYGIGAAYSRTHQDWATSGTALIVASSSWEGSHVFHPWLVKDGSQYVCYYAGNAGTIQQIGRATASNPTSTWSKYGSNPVVAFGTGADADAWGANGPVVHYDSNLSPAWKMWYAGQASTGTWTVAYADSSDGLSWTKRGKVIGTGAGGSFNAGGAVPGCVLLSGTTWYVYMAGIDAGGKYHGGYATCTDPADTGTYSSLTQLSNYSTSLTTAGLTWQKNQPRSIFAEQGQYRCYLTAWDPTVTTGLLEIALSTTSSDLINWSPPSSVMLAFDTWAAVSSENPSIVGSY